MAKVDTSHADLGGAPGYGPVPYVADEPVFKEPWEGRAFALTLLSINRLSGQNLDAMRHALERVPPPEYTNDGYYGRWLKCAEIMLADSGVVAAGAAEARARRKLGEDVEEPPTPELHKPDYTPAGPGSLRQVEGAPKFAVGQRVRSKNLDPPGHTRLPRYARGKVGVIERIQPSALLPDTNAHFLGENAQHVYGVAIDSHELFGPGAEAFKLRIDMFEDYLEAEA